MCETHKYSYIITELPRNINNGRIMWNNVVGMQLQIQYGDNIYNVEVIGKHKKKITIKYENNVATINQDQLAGGGIGKVLGKYVIDYRFKVGEVIEDLYGKIQILEQTRKTGKRTIKAYKYLCLRCGYTGIITESALFHKHTRCQVCCNNAKIMDAHINTLGALYPELIKYLENMKEVDLYLPGSSKKIKVKCPICGHIHEMAVYKLVTNGFYCPQCYSSNSYPNQLMTSILSYLHVDFKAEKVFTWSNRKQYDFYLPEFNTIIEMHGSGHYYGIYGTPAEVIQQNDIYKRDLALKNEITHYIEIDCKKENLAYIKNSIINHSQLSAILNVNQINFELCDNNINPNITHAILEKWREYHNAPDIAKDLQLSKHIVVKRLKICTLLGLINYEPKQQINLKKRKKVHDRLTGVEYDSISACAKALNISRGTVVYHSERLLIKNEQSDLV